MLIFRRISTSGLPCKAQGLFRGMGRPRPVGRQFVSLALCLCTGHLLFLGGWYKGSRPRTARFCSPSMPEVRLSYFEGYGLAEQTRWMMAAANIEWEQVALHHHEEFLNLRKEGKLLFGQLPLLEIDGLRLVQSQAMMRYVAQRGKLWGSTAEEAALIDMVAEGVKDARGVVVSYPFTPEKEMLAAEVPARTAKQLQPLEALVQKRPDGTLGFVSSGLCAADVLLAELVEELLNIKPDSMAPYPMLGQLHKQVVALPSLRSYLDGPLRFPFPKGVVGEKYVQNVQTVLGR